MFLTLGVVFAVPLRIRAKDLGCGFYWMNATVFKLRLLSFEYSRTPHTHYTLFFAKKKYLSRGNVLNLNV